MEHKYFLPKDDPGKAKWLNTFAKELLTYAPALGFDTSVTDAVSADAAFFSFVMGLLTPFSTYQEGLVGYKNALRDGSDASIGDLPAPPAIGAHTAVSAGIFKRATALVQIIKSNSAYNEGTMGKGLGIVGAEVVVDYGTLQPKLKAMLKNGHAFLSWQHEHTDAVDLYANYGDGEGFVLIGRLTRTHYLDGHLPAAGESKVYKYKIRYVLKDEPIGSESDIVAITVTGI
jgi:hypothetical protein